MKETFATICLVLTGCSANEKIVFFEWNYITSNFNDVSVPSEYQVMLPLIRCGITIENQTDSIYSVTLYDSLASKFFLVYENLTTGMPDSIQLYKGHCRYCVDILTIPPREEREISLETDLEELQEKFSSTDIPKSKAEVTTIIRNAQAIRVVTAGETIEITNQKTVSD